MLNDNTVGSEKNLDCDAGLRQAIGPHFERSKNSARALADLKNGIVTLHPHSPWNGDITDWSADPYKDRNWQFQFHTLRWINPFVWDALDGNLESKNQWLAIVKSWAQDNIPAHNAASPYAWMDMADGNRAIQICIGASLVEESDLSWYRALLEYHRDWLMDDEHIAARNHALHQNAGLFVVGAVLRDSNAMAKARERLIELFESAFDSEGINEEGSLSYQQLNLIWWKSVARRLELEDMALPSDAQGRLERAGEALAQLAFPNGQLPQVGDGTRGGLKMGLGEYTDFVASKGLASNHPKGLVKQYNNGYYVSRSGWGTERPLALESYLQLRHGTRMLGHAHEDRGSLQVFSQGVPWLVDSGFHSYQQSDPTRTYLNSRAAHNVLELPGHTYDPPADIPITHSEVTNAYHDVQILDGGYGHTDLQRRVIYLVGPDCWLIIDRVSGNEGRSLKQRWLSDTGVSITRHDRGFLLHSGAESLSMNWLGPIPRLRTTPAAEGSLDGWIGTKWKTLEPGTLITAEANSTGRGVVLLLAPSGEHGPLGIVQSYVTTTGIVQMRVNRGGKSWTVRVSDKVDVKNFD